MLRPRPEPEQLHDEGDIDLFYDAGLARRPPSDGRSDVVVDNPVGRQDGRSADQETYQENE